MRTLVRTMSIVQNVVKTLSCENPNKLQAIGTLGIDDDAVTTGSARRNASHNFLSNSTIRMMRDDCTIDCWIKNQGGWCWIWRAVYQQAGPEDLEAFQVMQLITKSWHLVSEPAPQRRLGWNRDPWGSVTANLWLLEEALGWSSTAEEQSTLLIVHWVFSLNFASGPFDLGHIAAYLFGSHRFWNYMNYLDYLDCMWLIIWII